MSKNYCLAVDACCDLPAQFVKENNIRILPIYLKFGDSTIVDNRDLHRTLDLYKRGMLEKNINAVSIPVAAEEMSKILEQELVLQYDQVLAVTISSTRSLVYKNVRDAVFVSQRKFKDLREGKGLNRDFRIQVLDSLCLFSGQGVLVHEAVRLLKDNAKLEEVAAKIEALKSRVRTFILPQDLYHMKTRARTKGDKSIGGLKYVLARLLNIKPIILAVGGDTSTVDKAIGFSGVLKKAFDSTMKAVEKGLSINAVAMSYAGDLKDLQKERAFRNFISFAEARGLPTLVSVMSTSTAINVGPRCFSISYAE